MKRAVTLLIASTLMTLAVVQPALARRLEGGHGKFDDTFSEVVCGVPVTTHAVGRFSFLFKELEGNSLPLSQQTVTLHQTWTNADGDWLGLFMAGSTKEVSIVQNADGTFTFITAFSGIPELIRGSDGTVLIKDVGRIVFATIFDASDPDNLIFISQEVLSVAGPHPEADSDFTLFCEVFVAELG